jgi:hypothetical protein
MRTPVLEKKSVSLYIWYLSNISVDGGGSGIKDGGGSGIKDGGGSEIKDRGGSEIKVFQSESRSFKIFLRECTASDYNITRGLERLLEKQDEKRRVLANEIAESLRSVQCVDMTGSEIPKELLATEYGPILLKEFDHLNAMLTELQTENESLKISLVCTPNYMLIHEFTLLLDEENKRRLAVSMDNDDH